MFRTLQPALIVLAAALSPTIAPAQHVGGVSAGPPPSPIPTGPPKAMVTTSLKVSSVSLASVVAQNSASSVPVTIYFTNMSAQVITAFYYRVTATFDNGRTEVNAGGLDMIDGMAFPPGSSPNSDGLRVGDSRSLVYNVRLSTPGMPPAHVEVEPTMVAFIDRTVVGDSISISQIIERRKQRADEMAYLVSDLKAASAETSPFDAIGIRVSALNNSPADTSRSRRAQNLSRYQELAKGGKSVLDKVVEPVADQQRLLSLHSTLTEVR